MAKQLQETHMSTVAEQLRQARESQGLSVQQVVEITKMRSDHVKALEQGDYSVFSAPVYIRGFVRTYASALKMNLPQVMEQVDLELGHAGHGGDPTAAARKTGTALDRLMLFLSKVDWAKGGVLLLALLAIGALAFVFVVQSARKGSDPLAGQKPRIYRAPTTGGETLPLPPPTPQRPR